MWWLVGVMGVAIVGLLWLVLFFSRCLVHFSNSRDALRTKLSNFKEKNPGETWHPAQMTPEHGKRPNVHADLHPDIGAAYAYVETMVPFSDFADTIAWHGWALREGFLAGISHGEAVGLENSIKDYAEVLEQLANAQEVIATLEKERDRVNE